MDGTGSDEMEEITAVVSIDDADVRNLVLSYLIHYCYKETAEAFIDSTGAKVSPCFQSIDDRKRIFELARAGKIAEAIQLTNELYKDLLSKNSEVLFRLHCQQFIELIRSRKPAEALAFAQSELKMFGVEPYSRHPDFVGTLQDVLALLCYEDPESSPVGSYMSPQHRESTADALNSAILGYQHMPAQAAMEQLLKQMSQVTSVAKNEAPHVFARLRGGKPWTQ